MDKSVYNMKAEKIQRLVKQGDYETAAKICNTIDWSMVRSVRMLSLVSSVYEHVQQYDTATDILLMAYEEAPAGRRYLYKLTELSLASGNIRDAENYYKSYIQEASDDNSRFILRYKIAEAKGESLDKRITILEAFKRIEFDEEWSYKLALLYAKAKQVSKCIALCDEIILWFGVGPYVDRAIELKDRFAGAIRKQYGDAAAEEISRPVSHAPAAPAEPAPEQFEEPDYTEPIEPAETPRHAPASTAPADDPLLVSGFDSGLGMITDDEKLPTIEITGTKNEAFVNSLDEEQLFPEEVADRDEPLPQLVMPAQTFRGDRGIKVSEQVSSYQPTKRIDISDIREQIIKGDEEPGQASAGDQQSAAQGDFGQLSFDWNGVPDRSGVNHIIYVTADNPEDGLRDSIDILAKAHLDEGSELKKVAKISAVKLNAKGLVNSLGSLEGKDLIILGANALLDDLLNEVERVANDIDREKFFVMADSISGIEELKARMHGGNDKAADTIVIPTAAIAGAADMEDDGNPFLNDESAGISLDDLTTHGIEKFNEEADVPDFNIDDLIK